MAKIHTYIRSLLSARFICIILEIIWLCTKKGYSTTKQLKINDNYECQIHDVDHWDKSVGKFVMRTKLKPCKRSAKLTYPLDGKWLAVNHTILNSQFSGKKLSCIFKSISRQAHSDTALTYGPDVPFNLTAQVKIKDGFIRVSCTNINSKLVYMNYHTFVLDQESVVKRIAAYDEAHKRAKNEHWNVIILGTDTLSLGYAIRYFVKMREFLFNELNATELLGYTRVGENTYTNLVPLHTGQSREAIDRKSAEPLNYLPLIFKNYSAAGYRTFYAEDMPWGTAFNYLLPGFREPPTDYYYHPLALAVKNDEKKLSWSGCEREGITNHIILDYLKQFVTKFQHGRFFAESFMSEMSHDYIHRLRRLDEMYVDVLRHFKQIGVFNNTFLFTYGDHGPRHGNIVKTKFGRLESNIPLMSVIVPAAFAKKYPHYVENPRINSRRLTTHYDTYRTLLDILNQANHEEDPTFPKGQNLGLFAQIPKSRRCMTAGVPLVFCVCYTEEEYNVTNEYVKQGAVFLVNEINRIVQPFSRLCRSFTLEKTASAVLCTSPGVKNNIKSGLIFKLRFFTTPGHGEFVGVVKAQLGKNGTNVVRQGEITRVNTYGTFPNCINNRDLKLYCYCRN